MACQETEVSSTSDIVNPKLGIPAFVERQKFNHANQLKFFMFPKVLTDSQAVSLFQALESEIEYLQDPFNKVSIFGRQYVIPRQHVAFGDSEQLTYRYSNLELPTKVWTPLLQNVCDYVSKIADCDFNYLLINRYKDGNDTVGFHSDDEIGLDGSAPIACLSLGCTRQFEFKHATNPAGKGFVIPLHPGSLLVMHPPTQTFYKHSLPRSPRVRETRISLTFRKMLAGMEEEEL
jgi:alpha-ketoglutarate-dependent dioxygenase alkB family protein 2